MKPFWLFNESSKHCEFWWVLVLFVSGLEQLAYPALDEQQWVEAGRLFASAIASHDWAATYVGSISGHPGVTVLWISATAHWLYQLLPWLTDIFVVHRFLFLIVKTVLIVFILKLIPKTVPMLVVFMCGLYWLLDRYLVGAGSTWLDQLLSLLMTIGVLLWIKFLQSSSSSLVRVLQVGVVFGLALLTKVAAIFLIPMFAAIALTKLSLWRRIAVGSILIALAAVCVNYVLYPALWSHPEQIIFARVNRSADVELGVSSTAVRSPLFYITSLFAVDVVVFLGFVAWIGLFYTAVKKRFAITHELELLGRAGAVYVGCLLVISMILIDHSNGSYAFLSSRYLAPVIPLFSIVAFEFIATELLAKQRVWILVVLFAIKVGDLELFQAIRAQLIQR